MRKPKGQTPLQKFLNQHNLTHQDVAEKIPISRSYFTQIANGTRCPSLFVAQKISALLNVPIDYLFPPS